MSTVKTEIVKYEIHSQFLLDVAFRTFLCFKIRNDNLLFNDFIELLVLAINCLTRLSPDVLTVGSDVLRN